MTKSGVTVRSFDSPDEEWALPGGATMAVLEIGGVRLGRGAAGPGWRWSKHVKPAAGTTWCELEHVGIILSGREVIRMSDGTETELGPGDAFSVPPGHDAWVAGDEPCVSLDFLGTTADDE